MATTRTKDKKTKSIQPVQQGISLLTEHDIYLFKEGRHVRLYDKLGAHLHTANGATGVYFAVWAPNARLVAVVGDFNGWRSNAHPLMARADDSGIWEGFIPGVTRGAQYKYHLTSHQNNYQVEKTDPFAIHTETPPRTASVVWDLDYQWGDKTWMQERGKANALSAPMSIYETHLGSWKRVPDEDNRPLRYSEHASQLTDYVRDMGFTHVEFLPVTEHPFYGSWGYQTTGYFAPTARYGAPQEFMQLVDRLHQDGVSVILDWVPSHFPTDEHGLVYFDGTYLFEHADPQRGFHPEWKSSIFNYGRHEVRSILISSALFWIEKYHIDGLRVDAVASMLYLDYARKDGEWIPNEYGGKENIHAIQFLRDLNEAIYRDHPDTQTIAEESTSWPMVSRPIYLGGLGFGMKWNMGWMHDTLDYFSRDPIHRKYHHDQLTFSIMYAFHENFVLPISHDEVVYGKGSLLGKMPGDDWQKFANLRLLFGYMYGHPGKKLMFMGSEFGQWNEWNHDQSLDWHLLEQTPHQGVQHWVKDLNYLYRREPALYSRDFDSSGFEWADLHDWENSTISFFRKGENPDDVILVVCNFTPVPRANYRIGVPRGGYWRELLNSDATLYGGSGQGNVGGVESATLPCHGHYHSVSLTLPPLSVVYLKAPAAPDR
ncbi:MAG: 1,4-alpha-glucan branching protein GlgB [Sulfuricaulis sp.]|uniref:1,4-alpha-glucan branching protein GlgB n=1 Tax=Sulfuricaulis sp. TaxID=2003553 RepID=UPI0025F02698|nr:1,4-alpha-glucan branching protein GlgB [Sulfuricaulis sp.]MCR4345928.1 1,4-alpha-glucan branching protein GlgB [Sulfuricaulis sp.]